MQRRQQVIRGEGETRVKVTIFGGGVTGLSAAHELMERGFDVTVVERREDPFVKDRCQVGGMARTQWSRFPAVEVFDKNPPTDLRRARPPIGLARAAASAVPGKQIEDDVGPERDYVEIRFQAGSAELDEEATHRLFAVIERLKEYVKRYLARDAHGNPTHLKLRGTEKVLIEGSRISGEDPWLSLARARTVHRAMHRILDLPLPEEFQSRDPHEKVFRYERYISLRRMDFGEVLCRDEDRPTERRAVVTIRVAESAFPGEHGYRYFPAFYKHLFDTMGRIPITDRARVTDEQEWRLEVARKYRNRQRRIAIKEGRAFGPFVAEPPLEERELNPAIQTGRTVLENVVPTELHSFAQADGELPVVLSRRRPRSLKELLGVLRAFQEKMGLELADLARYQMKLLEYMTSCPARRDTYERLAWKEFVGTEGFSKAFEDAMSVWPQALVGMRAGEIDARTAGNITVQIVLDQLREFGFVDGTLNDATSLAWLEPWRQYLDSEGVNFVCGSLDAIRISENGSPSFVTSAKESCEGDYYVLALPVEEVHRIAKEFLHRFNDKEERERWHVGTDLGRVTDLMRDWDRQQLEVPNPTNGPLRHLSGIQYFLEHDFRLVRGHTYYPSSPWALTSISQAQFRSIRPMLRDEYRGVLSVDIGNWEALGTHLRKPAWKCTPDELAREIWAHIDDGTRRVDRKDRSRVLEGLPKPVWYHIDDEILFAREDFDEEFRGDRTADGVALNRSPYLVNLPGAWEHRPGGEPDELGHYGYDLLFANRGVRGVVLAGTYMKTHSRLVTMEAANESARHAVNRILKDCLERKEDRRVGQYCQVFPLEERELDDLSVLKDLDAKLCERELPHLFKILDLYGMLGRSDAGNGLGVDQVGLVGHLLDEILQSFAGGGLDRLRGVGIGSEVIQALRRMVAGGL